MLIVVVEFELNINHYRTQTSTARLLRAARARTTRADAERRQRAQSRAASSARGSRRRRASLERRCATRARAAPWCSRRRPNTDAAMCSSSPGMQEGAGRRAAARCGSAAREELALPEAQLVGAPRQLDEAAARAGTGAAARAAPRGGRVARPRPRARRACKAARRGRRHTAARETASPRFLAPPPRRATTEHAEHRGGLGRLPAHGRGRRTVRSKEHASAAGCALGKGSKLRARLSGEKERQGMHLRASHRSGRLCARSSAEAGRSSAKALQVGGSGSARDASP